MCLKKELSEAQFSKRRVSGNSMFPLLHHGDEVIIEKKDCYQSGDILVFLYNGNAVVVHRLLKKFNGYIYCKGDNNENIERISAGDIAGSVAYIIRNGEMYVPPKV